MSRPTGMGNTDTTVHWRFFELFAEHCYLTKRASALYLVVLVEHRDTG